MSFCLYDSRILYAEFIVDTITTTTARLLVSSSSPPRDRNEGEKIDSIESFYCVYQLQKEKNQMYRQTSMYKLYFL